MCGLTGFLSAPGGAGAGAAAEVLSRMAERLRPRGPDDSGIHFEHGCGLAHRRLAIIDPTPDGHQPMSSDDGRYTLVFNGEIYNFRELRRELGAAGQSFHGHSDTEVLLAAIVRWGAAACLPRLNGMFAFALWDRERRCLFLARDRFGEKPLYYGWQGDCFLFGSELKAMQAHPSWVGRVSRAALTLYCRHGYVPSPYSIYEDVFKLMPGCLLRIDQDPPGRPSDFSPWPDREGGPSPQTYWRLADVAARGRESMPDDEAVDRLEEVLQTAVSRQMVADVPLGAFLSGGIDSSTVVALMQAVSRTPVRTFTIGFDNADYDEADHARRVATHLGTEHTEFRVTAEDARTVIPGLAGIYDEPFADSSAIPTVLISRLARERVTVCLSGDAGDELFAGYNRYFWGRSIWRSIGGCPVWLRAMSARAMTRPSPDAWDALSGYLRRLPGGRRLPPRFGDQVHKLAAILSVRDEGAMYRRLVSLWQDPAAVVIDGHEPATVLGGVGGDFHAGDFVERMMYLDGLSYLPDDILVKVDRAAMSTGLETRVPLLDPDVVALAWRLPMTQKIRHGQGKWLLRQVLYRHVPKTLVERPKMGFGVPIADWLRGPLRPWAEGLLDEDRLRREGFLVPEVVRRCWDEHLSGRRNWAYRLWTILMFQAWCEAWGGR